MTISLAAIRKSAGLTQEELGRRIADKLERQIGKAYAQKKIARFESGAASPTEDELAMMAQILGSDIEELRSAIVAHAPHEASSVIGQASARAKSGRVLIATCSLSRPRPHTLDESLQIVREAANKNLSIAVFVPYPMSFNVVHNSDHINNLFGHYARVRKAILEATQSFRKLLEPERADSIALYFPKTDIVKASSFLLPPIFRQYSLMITKPDNEEISKSLNMWSPGADSDTAFPIEATGLYSLDEQIEAWESFFGEIIPHWVEKSEFLQSDDYWERVK